MINPISILITGAGGAAAPELIKSLQEQDYRVVAVDTDQYAPGLYWANKGYVIPKGDSPAFIPTITKICLQEDIKAIIPLVDEELIPIFELEKKYGIIIILPRIEFVKTCLDKFILMRKLSLMGIDVPDTSCFYDYLSDRMNFPIVIKPRIGRGSRNLSIIHSKTDWDVFIKNISKDCYENFLVQKYISGAEYTVSVVVWRDGEVQAVVPKEIILKKGITKIGITRKNPAIDSLCRKVQEKLRADGPFNVQLKIDDQTRQPVIFEINPRFSTTVVLTMEAGIDEMGGILKQALSGRKSYQFGDWKENIVMMRGVSHDFLHEKEFLSIKPEVFVG